VTRTKDGRDSIGPVGPPGNIPARTGNWALSQPAIDEARCNACLLCWIFCPEGVINRRFAGDRELAPTIDLAYCKGCGICERECNRGAIRMVER
jgi:2-oxoacid:acceptor oxidoreductase delta subunit (pyruvate/2-ketoisovalerate family)